MAQYHKPKREAAKKQIRRLIVESGLNNTELAEHLRIPLRSVQRYVGLLYRQDNELLKKMNNGGGEEELLTCISIARDRLQSHKLEIMQNIARNPRAPFADRIKAWNLCCEIEAADLRLVFETTPAVVRSSLPEVRGAIMLEKYEDEYSSAQEAQGAEEEEEQEFEFDTEQEDSKPQ